VVLEGPTGLSLSGGIDSAVLASIVARTSSSAGPMAAFSMVGADADDESRAIASIERACTGRIVNTTFDCSGATALDEIDQFDLTDDPVLVPLGFLPARIELFARARAAGLHALLDGEGGDELFGLTFGLRDALQQHRWVHAWKYLRNRPGRRSLVLRAVVLPMLPAALRTRWAHRRAQRGELFPSYLTPRAHKHEAIEGAAQQLYEALADEDFAGEVGRWLSNPVMVAARKSLVDIAAQRGLSLASPLLDRSVVEFILGIPPESLLTPIYKGALREAAVGRLPDEVRAREKDIGLIMRLNRAIFASPAARRALRDPLVRDRLADWVRFDRVEGVLDAIATGYDPGDGAFWRQIESLVAFAYWYRRAYREHGVA
jgi:asparagine synthase (glutamine-hydrolysing)